MMVQFTIFISFFSYTQISVYNNPDNIKFLTTITQVLTNTLAEMGECSFDDNKRGDLHGVSQNFIKTSDVHAKSSSYRASSPLRNLMNFVRWMQLSS
jgi:hypothetical protein